MVTRILLNKDLKSIFSDIEHEIVRSSILNGEPGLMQIQIITNKYKSGNITKNTWLSSFCRGETQALVVATLGTSRDEQKIDSLLGEESDRFMLHYNFPPYSTGEVGRVKS